MKSPFTGEWTLDFSRSRQWDWDNQCWIPDQIEREDLRLYVEGDVYDWDLWAGADPAYRLCHSGRIDGDWAPYMCRDIVTKERSGRSAFQQTEASRINKPVFELNKPTAFVRLVRVNDRMIYRIVRNPDHQTPNYVLSTRVIDDDTAIEGFVMAPNGQVCYHRVMTRVS